MSEIIQNFSSPAVIEAVEANMAEEMACIGRGIAGGEVHEDAELLWMRVGAGNGPNGVLNTHLISDDKAYIDKKIADTIDIFKAHAIPLLFWSVGQSTYPRNMGTYLEGHGFTHRNSTTAMVIDTEIVNTESLTPPGFLIKEIEDLETLQLLRTIEMKGFDATEEYAQHYYDGYALAGFGKDKAWHHYLGWLDNEPVAIGSLLLYKGIAGIYGVATIPSVRKQGIGAAMTLYAMHEARNLGYRVAMLTPTGMSKGIYQRIGFQDHTQLRHYTLQLAE